MQKSLFGFLLIAIGCLIFLFSLSSDWLHHGSPGIGFYQLVGITIGLIIMLIGIRNKLLSPQLKWDWLLFIMYLSVILVVGLRPPDSFDIYQNSLLGMNTFSTGDFLVNVAGFIPLGFLIFPLLRNLVSANKMLGFVAFTAVMGFSVSLLVEVIQYLWIPGRYSSAYDLVANTIGTIIGMLCWLKLECRRLIS